MKRLSLVFLLVVLLAGITVYSHADGDVPSDWASEVIDEIRDMSIISDSMLVNFQAEMNRRDFAYLAVIIFEGMTGKSTEVGNAKFLDSKDEYVLRAKNAKLVDGYPDGSYKPLKSMNRAEIAKLFINVLERADTKLNTKSLKVFSDDFDIPLWAKEPVYTAKAFSIVEGVGQNTFAPNDVATREQALVMFYRIYQKYVMGNTKTRLINQIGVGSKAPDFSLNDQYNVNYSLKSGSAKSTLLVFLTNYDKLSLDLIDTINDNYEHVSKNVEVIGVLLDSKDATSKLKNLSKQVFNKFSMLVDVDGVVAQKFSVVKRPCSYLIDSNNTITDVVLGQFDKTYLLSLKNK